MKLVLTLERDETGMVVAECPAIPGCCSEPGCSLPSSRGTSSWGLVVPYSTNQCGVA
jgi:hypothetical protein